MTASPRVRFAPSPTGYLHVGGARTALFNWLYARKTGGAFLLRIEDTDRERSSEEHTRAILDGLTWLGLDWNEDIVFQGAGVERHRALAARLLAEGKAYEDEGAVRFRMPAGQIAWDDVVYGRIAFQGSDIQDWVILRSDRTPTYNFVVVADDFHMRITHVIRGQDHVSNTPKQIAVYRALGHEPPTFVHVPMIHGPDGKKLSKRHGATAVGDYRRLGILSGAMRNFLALLGWNPGGDRELFFAMDELIDAFSLDRVQKTSAVFDMTKLEWMNGQHMGHLPPAELRALITQPLRALHVDSGAYPPERIERAIVAIRSRCRTTLELAQRVAVRLDAAHVVRDDPKARKLIEKNPEAFRRALSAVRARLAALAEDAWEAERVEGELRRLAEELGVGIGQVMQPVRVALTGETVSEPVNELLVAVGREESLQRLARSEQERRLDA